MMNIYQTISAVMNEIGAIGKDSKNQSQGFMYRGIDAVMNAINPALIKYKLFIIPEVLEQIREERTNAKGTTLLYSICKVKYTFYAEDGSSVSAVVIGEGMDSGDKATNKAMSIAFKYACFQVFCIPTEEMIDPDAECHEVAPKNKNENKTEIKEDIESKKITTAKVNTIKKMCKDDNVPVELLLTAYKIKDLSDMTEKAFLNVTSNWEKVKAKAQEK